MLAYPPMKRVAFLLAALAPLLAPAADPPAAGTFNVSLEAKGMHEECMRLDRGEKRSYYWRADGPVDFNVHYHLDDKAVYPVKRDGMRGDGGSFVAKSAEDYCWMWTARDRPVRLEGRIGK
jgi:hypothetical protein